MAMLLMPILPHMGFLKVRFWGLLHLHCMYLLYDLIRKHLLDCVMYADDTQIYMYVMFSSNEKNEAMRKLQIRMYAWH